MKISPSVVRVAFGVIIAVVLAQVLWWIIFQHRYVHMVTTNTIKDWQREVDLINTLPLSIASKKQLLEANKLSHITFKENKMLIQPQAIEELEKQQQRYIRMFKYESIVFVVGILLGLFIIYQNLQTERELKRRQENFLNAISHEFNTPIATLKLLIQTVQQRNLSTEKQNDYLAKMVKELSRLENTSEQILASARLEQFPYHQLTTVDLNNLVKQIINDIKTSLVARGANLNLNYTSSPLTVAINPDAFKLVITNLLDNALKYSVGKEKIITVRLEETQYLAKIHIEDQGIGINPKEIKNIFKKFYRAGNELTREFKGVGLGLYLVKSISEAMNGWVKCESLAQGTRFTVVFPKQIETH